MKDSIIAKYLVETPHPVEFAAEMIAGGRSSGTFVAVPGDFLGFISEQPAQTQYASATSRKDLEARRTCRE
jgi:hypothetical protein